MCTKVIFVSLFIEINSPFLIKFLSNSQEWATEGYQLWMVKVEGESCSNLIQMDFIKSPLSVNPCMVSSCLIIYLKTQYFFF